MKKKKFSTDLIFMINLAKKAGNILLKGFHSTFNSYNKEGIHNLVTDYDLLSEKFIISKISKKYPNASILSEEKGQIEKNSKTRWIIDPLDGTVNFAHHIPFFAVNIALEVESEIIAAVTYCPTTKELFFAEKNMGAYLNNKKIQVSTTAEIERSILATGFPYNLKLNPEKCIDKFINIIRSGMPIRRLGSAALDLAYLADGRFDGYWETNLGPWDIASGILLIKEAGGKITNWHGKQIELNSNNTVACSNSKIHEPLIAFLKNNE